MKSLYGDAEPLKTVLLKDKDISNCIASCNCEIHVLSSREQ